MSLSMSPSFIQAIGLYISHLDSSIRRCGMLVAEIVAERTGKTLDFDQWSGQGDGREWCRSVRALVKGRDVDSNEAAWDVDHLEIAAKEAPLVPTKESKKIQVVTTDGHDSDDSLTGYASSSSSSRSPSPTMEEMEEIEKDPTLNILKPKIQKPVYLADLASMLQDNGKTDDANAPDRLEVALSCAEELIRRKRDFGLELGVFGFLSD